MQTDFEPFCRFDMLFLRFFRLGFKSMVYESKLYHLQYYKKSYESDYLDGFNP